jgi:hypothetical protein
VTDPDGLSAALVAQLGDVPILPRDVLAREVRTSFAPSGVELRDPPDTSESLVMVDLTSWPTPARIELQEVLQIRNLEHVWEGARLAIPDRLEYSFDEALSELHAAALSSTAADDTTSDPSEAMELTRFDLKSWAPGTALLLEHTLAGQWPLFEEAWASVLADVGAAATFGMSAPWVPHAWEERVLVVRVGDAPGVETTISAIENQVLLALDDKADKLAYDLEEISDDELSALLAALVAQGIPHRMSVDYELFVHDSDEDAVEAIFDAIENPDELDAQPDGPDGLEVMRILSDLFVASDRLYKDGRNPDGIIGFFDAADEIVAMSAPYGFSETGWEAIAEAATEVRRRLEDEKAHLEDVEEAAAALRAVLIPIV